jgi:hypothetical protein
VYNILQLYKLDIHVHNLLFSCYIQAHTKGISALVMLSEGTLLSGGERDRKIIAWDTLQNYKKITETKVSMFIRYYFLLIFMTDIVLSYCAL